MIEFKPAYERDKQNIKDIARRVIFNNYTSFLGSNAVADFVMSGASDKEIDDGINNCVVMSNSGEIVSFAITFNDLLHLIMVDVPLQNLGYGSQLLAYVETKMFADYKCIHLQTFQENECAVKFYLKNGWKVIDKQTVPELGKTMLTFEKNRS